MTIIINTASYTTAIEAVKALNAAIERARRENGKVKIINKS